MRPYSNHKYIGVLSLVQIRPNLQVSNDISNLSWTEIDQENRVLFLVGVNQSKIFSKRKLVKILILLIIGAN